MWKIEVDSKWARDACATCDTARAFNPTEPTDRKNALKYDKTKPFGAAAIKE